MKYEGWGIVLIWAGLGFVVGFMCIGSWIGRSYFEAQAFNRATGKNVSTWDAMFIELRVQEPVKD